MLGLAQSPVRSLLNIDNDTEDFTVGTIGFKLISGVSSFGLGLMYGQSTGTLQTVAVDQNFTNLGTKNRISQHSSGWSVDQFGVCVLRGRAHLLQSLPYIDRIYKMPARDIFPDKF